MRSFRRLCPSALSALVLLTAAPALAQTTMEWISLGVVGGQIGWDAAAIEKSHKTAALRSYLPDGGLVVRRGEPFRVALSKDVTPKSFTLRLGGSDVSVVLPAVAQKGVTLDGLPAYDLKIPTDAPIGTWSISVDAGGKVTGEDMYVTVLFNPYDPKSDIYMADTLALAGYLDTDTGATLHVGGAESSFDAALFAEALATVDTLPVDVARDPAAVLEALAGSASVNGNGVLWGRWDGEYADGKEPGTWSGSFTVSAPALGKPKYGQCWVFSGTLTSMARSLGIPSRTVTNLDSAHESKGKGDSAWNFHVWTEAWTKRADQGQKAADWNAYDGTCQEESDGLCVAGARAFSKLHCKPSGSAKGKYDCDFVAGETNSDVW